MTTSPKIPASAVSPTTVAAETATETTNQPEVKAAPETVLKKEMAQKRASKKQPKPETAAAAPASTSTDDDEIVVRTVKPVTVRVGLTHEQVALRAKKAAEQKEQEDKKVAEMAAKVAANRAKAERLKTFLVLMTALHEKGERMLADPTHKNYNNKCCVDRTSEVDGKTVLVIHTVAYPISQGAAEAGEIIFNRLHPKQRNLRNRRLLMALTLEEAEKAQQEDREYEVRLQKEFEEAVLVKFQAGLDGKPGINGEVAITAPASKYVNFEAKAEKDTYLKLLRGEFVVEQDGKKIPIAAPKDELNPGRPITHVAIVGANLVQDDEELKVVFCSHRTAEALKSLAAQKRLEIKGGIHHLFMDKERSEITLYGLSMGRKYFVTQRQK